MKTSVKVALSSGLIFPGVGHFMLKCYRRGIIIFSLAMVSLVFILTNTVQKTFSILTKIENGAVPLDAQSITQLIAQTQAESHSVLLNTMLSMMVISWIVGIFDAYRLGKLKDDMINK